MALILLKRLLWIIPVSFVMLIALFTLNVITTEQKIEGLFENTYQVLNDIDKEKILKEFKANRPLFYFSIKPNQIPRDYFSLVSGLEKKWLLKLTNYFGNTTAAMQTWKVLIDDVKAVQAKELKTSNEQLFLKYYFNENLKQLLLIKNKNLSFTSNFHKLKRNFIGTIPVPFYHAGNNRFHIFIKDLFFGQWLSLQDRQAVFPKIWRAASITLFINLLAICFVVLISKKIAKVLYQSKSKKIKHFSELILHTSDAIPMFWLATIILLLSITCASAVFAGIPVLETGEKVSILTFLRVENLKFVLLPILTLVLANISYLTIQLWRAYSASESQKFNLAATAKGLSENTINEVHKKPIVNFTLISIIGNSIPGLISGSVIIELIFNIPGMGRALWQAVYSLDWPMVSGLLIIAIVFAVLGQLLTDFFYVWKFPQMKTALNG